MSFIVFYIIFVALIGFWASKLGRNVVLCILAAILLSPLVAGIYLLIVGKSDEKFKKCNSCAEIVKKEAVVCRYCNSSLDVVKESK
jgi:hypothetical protein